MFQKEFEEKFAEFLAKPRYSSAQDALYAVARQAFLAGWLAAGGEMPRIMPGPILPEAHTPRMRKPQKGD